MGSVQTRCPESTVSHNDLLHGQFRSEERCCVGSEQTRCPECVEVVNWFVWVAQEGRVLLFGQRTNAMPRVRKTRFMRVRRQGLRNVWILDSQWSDCTQFGETEQDKQTKQRGRYVIVIVTVCGTKHRARTEGTGIAYARVLRQYIESRIGL